MSALVQEGSYPCTVVIVRAANGFTDQVIETRVFMGGEHADRARKWGEQRNDWSRHVEYQTSSVEVCS